MAIKFYGGHKLNSKTKIYGTRQDFEVIEVDENGDPITGEASSQVSLHLNGTDSGIVDSSSNSHAVTTNGNVAVISGSPYDSTTSMSFDGSGDYISIADHDDFNFGSGDFTVEMWINAETQSTNWPGIFSGSDYNAAGSASLRFDNVGHDNKLFLYTNGLGDPALTTANTLSHNTWHHIALVRNGTSLSFYVNGTQDGTTTISSGQTFDFSVGEFRIGRGFDVDGGNAYFAGKIADVRAIKGSAVAPTAAPTSALTGSAGSQVVFAELSTTDVKTSYPPVIDGLSVSASNSQDTWSHGRATMSFTSGKYYWEAIPTGPGLIGLELDTADGNRTFHNEGTDTLSARSYNGGMIFKDGVKVIQGQTGWTDGDVVGIAVDGDTGDVQFYVNGVAQAGMSINTGWGSDKVKIPSYGVYKNGASNFSWLFNFGASGFAYSAPEGYQPLGTASLITASLLISGNGGVSDASSSSHSLTLNGDVTTALGSPYTSGNVIAFDGNGDFAHISNADFSYGTGDFTIEAWINSDDVTASGPRNIFTQRSQGGPVLRLWNSKLHYMRGEGQNALYSAENLLTAGQWHHVALVRSSGVVSIYLDGTSVASQAETYDFSSLTEVYVGSYGSQYEFFDGEIADFRITKAAVYTENFSVPTATLGDYPPRYYKTLATQYVEPIASYDFDTSVNSSGTSLNDAIILSNHSVGHFGSGNFTIDFWVNWGGGGTTKQIMSQKDPYDYAKQSWQIETDNGSLSLLRLFNNYNYSRIPLTYVNEHTWHHVSITRYGSDLIISNYNSSTGTTTQRTEAISGTVREVNSPVHIGSSAGSFDRFQGKLADIRISHAAEYHTNGVYSYTPPTAGLSVTPDTVALIRSKAEGETGTSSAGIGFVDYSGNTDMTLQYDPTIDTSDTIPPQS